MRLAASLLAVFLLAVCREGVAAAPPEGEGSPALIEGMLKRAEQAYEKGDFTGAFDMTRVAAEAGSAQAQFNLGVLYSRGEGTKKNYSEAARWYLKAADQGHRGAMLNLSVILEKGLGGVRDLQFAADLRRLAGTPGGAKPAGGPAPTQTAPAAGASETQAPAVEGSRPRRSRALLGIVLACLAALGMAGRVFLQRGFRRRQPLGQFLRTILAPSTPESQAYEAFWRYRDSGGDVSEIPVARLHKIFLAAGRESDLLQLKGLTPPQTLGLAKILSAAGRHADALKLLLEDAVLAGLSGQEDFVHDAIRLLERAGRLQDLAARLVHVPAAVSTAFAKGLLWVGKSLVCAEMLKSRKSLLPEEERLLAMALKPEGDLVSRVSAPGLSAGLSADGSGAILGGKYELRAILGKGGMGVVYAGYEPRLKRQVAIKRIRQEIRSDARMRRLFIDEAQMIAKVRHPYIVAIHDIVDDGVELYLIMDYVDGRPLCDILSQRRRLPLAECKSILRYVCEAVDHAHRMKVLHRDLKPANVMVDKEGFAMVMDFGLARQVQETVSRVSSHEMSGSPAYMAPEQHLGQSSRASDVYSLGAMLFEMLTGTLPFPGPDFLAQKERFGAASASRLAGTLPPGCDELLALALDPDPRTRLGSAISFYERLAAV